jgi:predicted RND superfamily exporter protein
VLRSFVGGALVLTPSLLAALVNLGVMGLVGTWLNLATASITSLTVSIGADYSIYFIFRFREEYRRCKDVREATLITMLTSGKAIFFVATAIAARDNAKAEYAKAREECEARCSRQEKRNRGL